MGIFTSKFNTGRANGVTKNMESFNDTENESKLIEQIVVIKNTCQQYFKAYNIGTATGRDKISNHFWVKLAISFDLNLQFAT